MDSRHNHKNYQLLNLDEKSIIEIKNMTKNVPLETYNGGKYKIKLLSELNIKMKHCIVPYSICSQAKEHIKNPINKGIIQKSNSKYFSSAFFIQKKNKELRLIVDYSEVNKHTIKEVFPCPNIHEYLIGFGNSQSLSSIDLMMGYHRILTDDDSYRYTSFNILNEQFKYRRMRLDYLILQRVMKGSLSNFEFVKIYLYDILFI